MREEELTMPDEGRRLTTMVGWVKLYRLLLESAIFQNAYALQVFIYLLLKAAYKEMKIPVGNKNIVLQPGQLLYGRKSVAEKLNMGEGKLRGVMEYLENNGSIEIESYSKYSVVTIVNWEKYQVGEVPEFPFDVDFLDDDDGLAEEVEEPAKRVFDPYEISYDGYKDWKEESYGEEFWNKVWGRETEPAKNQMQMQAQTGFQESEIDFSASREPQYNNINKNKYKNNKINNNKKTKENKTKENHKNIKNTKNLSYRQSESVVNDYSNVEKVAGLDTSQEMLLSDGAVISKGKVVCGDSANSSDADSQNEAFDALSSMDDAALDAYFESCAFADFDTVDENHAYDIYDDDVYDRNELAPLLLDDSEFVSMTDILDDYRRPGHEFVSEMVYELTPRDIEQLDAMFKCCSAAVGYDGFGKADNYKKIS